MYGVEYFPMAARRQARQRKSRWWSSNSHFKSLEGVSTHHPCAYK